MVYFGNNDATFYVGNSEVSALYFGSTEVWSAGPPIGTTYNFAYTGKVQSMELPKGTWKLEVWGAQGGYRTNPSYGGMGGYSVGTITLNQPTMIYAYAGGSGNTGGTSGGFNGGGKRSAYYGGGGASDIRIGTDSLYARVIVAGGGGSDGSTTKNGMYGGGTTGGSATQNYGTGGYGGSSTGVSSTSWQTTSQSTSTTSQAGAYAGFGFGGNGITRASGYGGAGGGGWYGGSGSYPDGSGDDDRGGGGGSGYVYTSSTASQYPSGCLLTSSHYLTDANTTAGNASFISPTGSSETGHSGNGYARITLVGKVSDGGGSVSKKCVFTVQHLIADCGRMQYFVNDGTTWQQFIDSDPEPLMYNYQIHSNGSVVIVTNTISRFILYYDEAFMYPVYTSDVIQNNYIYTYKGEPCGGPLAYI